MKTIYIEFAAPQHQAFIKKRSTLRRGITALVIRLITNILPSANPDFEGKIDEVEHWFVELAIETGLPQREIGLDAAGAPLLGLPWGRNCGYWTDNNLVLGDFLEIFQATELPKEIFDEKWQALGRQSQHLT